MIDALATHPHYWRHLAPVWAALARHGAAGAVYAPGARPWATERWRGTRAHHRPVLVAGAVDALRVRGPVVLVEHGAGQGYVGAPRPTPSYSGGPGLDHVVLFLVPGPEPATRWAAAYPAARVAQVGVPWLDPWHAGGARRVHPTAGAHPDGAEHPAPGGQDRPPGPGAGAPVVAVTFHWNCPYVPETRWAFPHYRRAVEQLARSDQVQLLGHGHPRAWPQLAKWWDQLGVDATPDPADVLDRADLLVGDNTSLLPEFASTGRPVLWLNAPWYRRDVHHGGRFWTWPHGQVQVDDPDLLGAAVLWALADGIEAQESRARMVRSVYARTDGHAADRAAAAIMEVIGA